MGLPTNVAKEIDRLVDNPKRHDFFDVALERHETPSIRILGGRIITYYFSGSLFYTPPLEEVRKVIERYGDDGQKAFFLHIWLDLIERNMRSGKGFAFLELKAMDYYKEYIDEVGRFLDERWEEVERDIKDYISRKRKKGEGVWKPRPPPPKPEELQALTELLADYIRKKGYYGVVYVDGRPLPVASGASAAFKKLKEGGCVTLGFSRLRGPYPPVHEKIEASNLKELIDKLKGIS